MANEKTLFPEYEDYESKIELLTKAKNWDSATIREILITLAKMGTGNYIPARNRPESINLETWQNIIDGLAAQTKESGREHGRTIFADIGHDKLKGGVVSRGGTAHMWISEQPERGRETQQLPIAHIHTHPSEFGNVEYGFSPQDYIAFFTSPEVRASVIAYGEGYRMLVMKTSVTPPLPQESLKRLISLTERESFSKNGKLIMEQFIDFNREICAQLGAVLFMSTPENPNLFKRIPVASA